MILIVFLNNEHVFDDSKRPPVMARLYPNELLTDFNIQLQDWILNKSTKYFEKRDPKVLSHLTKILIEIKELKLLNPP